MNTEGIEKLFLATHNAGKSTEIMQLLTPFGIKVLDATQVVLPDVAETGQTFVENALIKARHGARCSGLPTLADDSGLIVPVLKGLPGVKSARFAGDQATDEDNRQKLLQALSDVPVAERVAYFYCVLVLLRNPEDPVPVITQGYWHGVVLHAPRGSGGFGYDPIFEDPSQQKTAAELEPSLKNKLSHRGKALAKLLRRC